MLSLEFPGSFGRPLPGQFLMIRIKGSIDPLLGRPFSVYSYEKKGERVHIEVLYKVVGVGTRHLSQVRRGAVLEAYGPFGKTFEIMEHVEKIVLIAGGIGVAPVTYLASHNHDTIPQEFRSEVICYFGVTSAKRLIGIEKLKNYCTELHISSDDGSVGYHGSVIQLFESDKERFESEKTILCVCGPRIMLQKLSNLEGIEKFRCYVFMEERMACGRGACLGCAVMVRDITGEVAFRRVCTDGPVFDLREIVWDYRI